MSTKFSISQEEILRSKFVKPGWYVTLIMEVAVERSSKGDSNNVVLDGILADPSSEFYKVPFKHWLNEKGKNFPGGMVSFTMAMMGGSLPSKGMVDVDFADARGKYYYAKWGQVFQGKEGQQEVARNGILDWAPLPAKYADLTKGEAVTVASDVEGFES